MTQAGAAVTAAVIAAVAALIVAIVTNAVALRNETRRRRATSIDSDRQLLRTHAAEVFVQILHLQHEMEWLTWYAAKRPEALDLDRAEAYESAVHATYPRILGAMAVLASVDLDLYWRLQPLVDRLYNVEGEIGEQITGLSSPEQRVVSLARLAEYHAVARAFYQDLPPKLAAAMQHADGRYRHK